MNDEIDLLLKELKTEKVKITALIERCHEARITAISKHMEELTMTTVISPASSRNTRNVLCGYSTRNEVARHLNVSVRTVDNMTAQNIIPYFKIGGAKRFKLQEVDQALEEKYRIQSRYEHRW